MAENGEIKICRLCHTIYTENYCGNGCEHNKIFKEKREGIDIEPREIKLKLKEDQTIRWICLACKNDFDQEMLESNNWICPICETNNDFYPFTEKRCAICIEPNGEHRLLPIWAKACEKCGEKDFIINGNKRVKDLKQTFADKGERTEDKQITNNTLWNEPQSSWEGPPPIFEIPKEVEEEKANKNAISLTFTLFTTNYEVILFAESAEITLFELIKNSNGYIPDKIVEILLNKFDLKDSLFSFEFNKEKEVFFIKSKLQLEIQPLNNRFLPENKSEIIEPGKSVELPESKLTGIIAKIDDVYYPFKGIIWIY